MPRKSRFRTLLLQALKEFAERGYTSEADLQDWLMRLHMALERELPSDAETRRQLAAVLGSIFAREVDRAGLQRRVPGVDRYTIDRIAPTLRAELDRRIFAGVDLIKLNKAAATQKTLQRFSGWVTSVPRTGAPTAKIREAARDIVKPTTELKFQRRRVAIDQGHKLISAVAHVVAMSNAAIAGIWHDRGEKDHGYDARPEHLERTGKLFLVRDSWALNEGLIKKGGLQYTDEIEQPAELPFCFPGDTRIPFADRVEVAYRRWYSGELTEIVTDSGKTVRATPNHPVLTPEGWIACGALKEGDHVIEVAEQRVNGAVTELDYHDTEPMIAQVYGALAERGVAGYVGGSRFQFHGDGSEEDVDIVVADWGLNIDFVATGQQRISDFSLSESDLSGATARALDLLAGTGLTTAASLMRSMDAVASPLGAAALQVGARGLFDGADRSAGFANVGGESQPANADLGGQHLDRLAGFVAPTCIVHVKRLQWSGHVYNLQTASGYYIADGIVAHNCSCYYEYVTSPRNLPANLLTAKGRAWLEWGGARHDSGVTPSPAQLHAGNYPKGHIRFQGLDVSIETPKNALRIGVGSDGKPWSVPMPADYGYIRRTEGADGEHLDCYVGPNADAPVVFVVSQQKLGSGKFDEHKVMLGFESRQAALVTYMLGFSDGMGAERIGAVDEMTIDQFKTWLRYNAVA